MSLTGRAIVIAVFALLLVAPAAWAGGKPPSIDQYVEQIPTSKGPKPTGGPAQTVSRLPRTVERTIRSEGGNDAQALEEVATSSRFGAPKKIKVAKKERKQLEKKLRAKSVEEPKAIPAAIGAVSETGNGRLLALVIVMATMTAAALALAGLRRRGARR
jgi:hypothetical protein